MLTWYIIINSNKWWAAFVVYDLYPLLFSAFLICLYYLKRFLYHLRWNIFSNALVPKKVVILHHVLINTQNVIGTFSDQKAFWQPKVNKSNLNCTRCKLDQECSCGFNIFTAWRHKSSRKRYIEREWERGSVCVSEI